MNKISHSIIKRYIFIFFILGCKNDTDKKIEIKNIDTNLISNENLKKEQITLNDIDEFEFLINKLLSEKIISNDKSQKIDTINIIEHPLVIKLKKRGVIGKKNIEGKVLTYNFNCYNSDVQNKFQILYFNNDIEALENYKIFNTWVSSSSFFEKPYKFFFRFKNKIYYVTSDSKLTCSGKVIESLAMYFEYKVDYFRKYYSSGLLANQIK
ncbi:MULTISPECIES: hypothetical protein [Flavobacterium]|uniref:Lipoprotein n=1 Tax=Flavobacterium jumunjinense TaxID=998845 RepID=A0ABV5GPG6_9FLAO|nr:MULTISPECIES: hypothetical protein [Flavobacterium]